MPFSEAMGLTGQLLTQAQALAALIAHLRLVERGEAGDPEVRERLDRVLEITNAESAFADLDAEQRAIVISFARSYLRQAVDLIEDPARSGSWNHTDPAILQAQGSASGVVATLIANSGLGKAGARILDIGTGVAGLAIAFCNTFPQSTVVGIDPWEPSLALARTNVEEAGLASRITLIPDVIQNYEDASGFDLLWLPTFFVPTAVIDDALTRIYALSKTGATVVCGVFESSEDPLEAALDALYTVRSGGAALTIDETRARLEEAGFHDVREVERTWHAPVQLVVGTR